MIKKDKKVTVSCAICGRGFDIFVDSGSFSDYMENTETKSAKEYFPHLIQEEVELLETGICENCV